jgi:hypothetical protein
MDIAKKELFTFRDPAIAELAELARKYDAQLYPGGWVQLIDWSVGNTQLSAAPTAVNSFTAATNLITVPPNFIPANSLNVGTVLRIRAAGTIGSAAGTATTTFGFGFGGAAGVSMVVSASQTPPTSTVQTWFSEVYTNILTVGSSGTGYTIGYIVGIGATPATNIIMPATTVATSVINTTAANYIAPYATWSASAAGNTYSTYQFSVEQLN